MITDILPELRSLLAAQTLGSSAHATVSGAVKEIEFLRSQRDELQAYNTRVVEENRVLRARIAELEAAHVHPE